LQGVQLSLHLLGKSVGIQPPVHDILPAIGSR